MSTDYERNLKKWNLCQDLLSEFGDDWTFEPIYDRIHEGTPTENTPEALHWGILRHKEGFAVYISNGDWRSKKFRASIQWPEDHNGQLFSYDQAEGVPYNAASPTTEFDPNRKPKAIANQIKRNLITDQTWAAWKNLAGKAEKDRNRENARLEWIKTVKATVGPGMTAYRRIPYNVTVEVFAEEHEAGGVAMMKLSPDPGKAVKQLEAMRALLEDA